MAAAVGKWESRSYFAGPVGRDWDDRCLQLTLCLVGLFCGGFGDSPGGLPIPGFQQGDTSSRWLFHVLPQNLGSGCSY